MSGTTVAQSINHGMSTIMTHKAFGKHAEEALTAVRDEAVRLEELLSRFIPESEISIINRSAGVKPERISDETFEVLSRAVEFSRRCQGLFDVTIGPLVALWNGCKDTRIPPEDAKIKRVLPLVDYSGLILDPYQKSAMLRYTGQSIDLGGIGKGFAGDKLLKVFKSYGITSAYTNIGGNVVALGTKPDGSHWRVGIQHPRRENGLIGLVSVKDKAVVTSGDYQRYFIGSNGKRYHHILNPKTGYPVESGLVSATVVAENSAAADAVSTILFAAGVKTGTMLLSRFFGVEAVLVDTEMKVYITAGLKKCFQANEGISVHILNEK